MILRLSSSHKRSKKGKGYLAKSVSGQHPSLQIFYELVTFLDVSVDQFFFPNAETDKTTQRRQLDSLLADMDSRDLTIMTATAKGIQEANNKEAGE